MNCQRNGKTRRVLADAARGSLASWCRQRCCASESPLARVSSGRKGKPHVSLISVCGRSTLTYTRRPVAAKECRCGQRISRSVTVPSCRKPNASEAARDAHGKAAQRRARCWPATHLVAPIGTHFCEFDRRQSEFQVEPRVRTRPCGASQVPFACVGARAIPQERLVLRHSQSRRKHSLSEKEALKCDSAICGERVSGDCRNIRSVARGMRHFAQAIPEQRRHQVEWDCAARSVRIHVRVTCGFRGLIPPMGWEHYKSGHQLTINPRNRNFDAVRDRHAPAEVAGSRNHLPLARDRKHESKRVARPRYCGPVSFVRRESSAQCERQFPLPRAHRRLRRTPFEARRSGSVAQVRSLLNNFLTTLLGIRAAAECCSWNLPGLTSPRFGEKRKRNITVTVRNSRVLASQYWRKRKCGTVDIPSGTDRASANATELHTIPKMLGGKRSFRKLRISMRIVTTREPALDHTFLY
jgi:hypothetical protein